MYKNLSQEINFTERSEQLLWALQGYGTSQVVDPILTDDSEVMRANAVPVDPSLTSVLETDAAPARRLGES